MVRTVSPYFSSKKASAPPSIASAMVMNAMETGRSSRMMRRTSSSIARSSSSVSASVEREVEAQVVGRHQRAGLAGPLPDDVAQRAMEQMRARVVAHRVGASVGIDDRLHRLPDPQPAVERPAVDDQPTERLLRVGHREQLAATARLAQDALVADLAAALGVERRLVEDDLGLTVAGQLVELHPVAEDRDDPAVAGRRLVADEPAVAGATLDRAVERGLLGMPRELGLRPGSAPFALLGKRAFEAVAIDARRRTRRRARSSDRSGTRTCRGAGRRCRRADAARPAEVPPGVARPPDAARSTPSFSISDSSSFVPASSVRPNCASSRRDDAEDLVAPGDEMWVGLAHDVDDDRGGLGHERLAPPEQSAVADRTTEELAQDVAAALVRGQHVVGDQERDRPGMVGDDLVAEALALEGVRIVAEQLAHPGVDRREQVGVVVASGPAGGRSPGARGPSPCRRSGMAAGPVRRASGRTP